LLDALPLEQMDAFRQALRPWLGEHASEVLALTDESAALDAAALAGLDGVLRSLIAQLPSRAPTAQAAAPVPGQSAGGIVLPGGA
jgi:hypothetical protein